MYLSLKKIVTAGWRLRSDEQNSHLEICCIFSRSMSDDRWMVPCLAEAENIESLKAESHPALRIFLKEPKLRANGNWDFYRMPSDSKSFLKSTNRMPFGSFQNEEHKIFMGTVLQILNFFRNRRIFVAKAICKVFTTAESAPCRLASQNSISKKESLIVPSIGGWSHSNHRGVLWKTFGHFSVRWLQNKLGGCRGCLILDISCVLQR